MIHLPDPFKHETRIHLGHIISTLIIGRDVLDSNVSTRYIFPKEMPFDVKVASTTRDAMVVGKQDSSTVVLEDCRTDGSIDRIRKLQSIGQF